MLKINFVFVFIIYLLFSIFGGSLILEESMRSIFFNSALIILTIFNLFIFRKINIFKEINYYFSKFYLLILALVVGIFSSLIFSSNYIILFKIIIQYIIIFMYGFSIFMICFRYKDSNTQMFSFLSLLSYAVIIPSLLIYLMQVLFEFKTSFGVTAFHLVNIFGTHALEGVLGPVNTVFFAGMAIYLLILAPNFRFSILNFSLLFIGLSVVLLSVKRSGLFFIIELVFIVFCQKKYFKFVLVTFITLFILLTFTNFYSNFDYFLLGGSLENNFLDSRMHVLESLSAVFYESPILGFGLGFHNIGYEKYSQFSSTDSTYVSFLIDSGLLGFLFFIIWIFISLYKMLSLSKKVNDFRFFGVTLLFYSYSLFSDVMNNPSSAFIIFIIFMSCAITFLSKIYISETSIG